MGDESGTGAAPDMGSGAQAAVQYINSALHGVNGHPIKIISCDGQTTPQATSECASKLVADHPVAIVAQQLLSVDAALPIIAKSGIAFVTTLALSAAQQATRNSFVLTGGGTGGLLAADAYVKNVLHVSRVSAIYVDIAAGVAFAQDYVQGPLKKAGVQVQLVGQSAASPDATSALSSVASSHPGAVLMLTLPTAYPSVMQLHAEEGVKVPIIYQSNGLAPALVSAGGSGADGSLFTYDFTPFTDTADPQVATFVQAMKSYGGAAPVDGESQAGFASVMDTYTVLKTASTSVPTAAQVLSAFDNANNVPGFMGHSFSCKTPAIAGLSSICDPYEHIVEYKNGSFTVVGGNDSWHSGATFMN